MADCAKIKWPSDAPFDTRHPPGALDPIRHCAICGRERKLVADHDHGSGRYRNKLCFPCNTGLGMFQDDPTILQRAVKYLKYWKLKDLFEDNQ